MNQTRFFKKMIIPRKKKLFCNNCKIDTNHTYKSKHHINDYEDLGENFYMWYEYYFIFWICAGCEHGTLERIYTNDTLRRNNNGEDE